jgi:hypothetical protein
MTAYDEELTNLDECLRRLKIEYHIFFNGNRRNPPDDLRSRVERLVKKLSECSDLSYSQRFRYTTLITRYHVYRDLWRRAQQEREMGAEPAGKTIFQKAGASPHSAGQATETVRISISDPKAEQEKVRTLYDALIRIKGLNAKETPPSYQQFANYIVTQTCGIREKYRCSKVAFTIALEDDAIRFTAAAEKC